MTGSTLKLTHGQYYHIYNRGINSCNLFYEDDNYEYLMHLYDKYISNVAETFAWVLMPNHFHFVVRIKDEPEMTDTDNDPASLNPLHQHFSNLFNAYTKAFNKRFNRHGSLFERPFKRKLVEDSQYLRNLIVYVHNNPVHHGFCSHTIEYPWSSYITCISQKQTKLKRDEVVRWFDNVEGFISSHNQDTKYSEIDNWLGLNSSVAIC
jgi:REP element-mobilizing transposase RayT